MGMLCLGMGKSLVISCWKWKAPFHWSSVFWQLDLAWKFQSPSKLDGGDTIHMHPNADGAAYGAHQPYGFSDIGLCVTGFG